MLARNAVGRVISLRSLACVIVGHATEQETKVVTRNPERVEPMAVDRFAAGGTMPTSIGLCADEYHDVREERLRIEKLAEGVKARESELREHIITNLSKSDDTGAAGKRYRAQIVTKVKPKLSDWTALCQVIRETGRFDLVQKRLGEKAVEDLWADGYDVPGVERMQIPEVSITKI